MRIELNSNYYPNTENIPYSRFLRNALVRNVLWHLPFGTILGALGDFVTKRKRGLEHNKPGHNILQLTFGWYCPSGQGIANSLFRSRDWLLANQEL
eukprot:sb/3479140/